MNGLRSHIKNAKEFFIRYPSSSNSVKKNSAAPRFFNPLLGVGYPDETLFLMLDIITSNSQTYHHYFDYVVFSHNTARMGILVPILIDCILAELLF